MLKIIAIILYLFISINCFAQWIIQPSGTLRHLLGMDILDNNTGYICGDLIGAILKTTNSGENWIKQPEPLNDQYNGISFIDNNTGIAVGPPGIVLRTSNGGLNWLVISRPGGDMGDVRYGDVNTVYACGDNIIKSTNGGLNWFVLINAQFLGQFRSLSFINQLTGTVVGLNGTILTTTNGGLNWTQRYMMLPVQFGDSSLYSIQYINSLTGFISGNNGIVVKTSNGGVEWMYLPTGTITRFQGIFFINEMTGYVTGTAGRLFQTRNGGTNWIQQPTGVTSPLKDVEFINENTGWICGFNGTILKTTNGGTTWIQPVSTEIPDNFKLYQNSPNPFNPVTKIAFSIPSTQYTILKVYDGLGREVKTLINEKLSPGSYESEFPVAGGVSNIASGIYFYRLESGDFVETRRMVLLK